MQRHRTITAIAFFAMLMGFGLLVGGSVNAAQIVSVHTAGFNDTFDPAFPVLRTEITDPSSDLLLMMDPYAGGDRVNFPHREFDDVLSNRVFGHTFTNLCECPIVGATLEIKLRLGHENDNIHLERTGAVGNTSNGPWVAQLTKLYTQQMGGGTWTPGTDHTFILDLADLPADDQNDTNILALMNADHALDVYVQDDTAVDYMVLTVYAQPIDSVHTAGIIDNFDATLPILPLTELTSPSSDLLRIMDLYAGGDRVNFPHREFDEDYIDGVFGHTFTDLPGCIVGATLEIKLRLGHWNDIIHLERTGVNTSDKRPWRAQLTELFFDETDTSWTPGTDHTFIWDLAKLPAGLGGDSNLLDLMNDDHALDVYVQDDTAVDYMVLTVDTCCCPDPVVDMPVPVAGLVGLGLLAGACALGGASVLRRKR